VGKSGYVITPLDCLYGDQRMVHWESKGSLATVVSRSVGASMAATVVWRRPQSSSARQGPGNPKFYLYGPASDSQGIAIAVMVADKPEGPFKDARGIPILPRRYGQHGRHPHVAQSRSDRTRRRRRQAYLAWGNKIFFTAKLEDDMIHLRARTYTLDASGNMQNRSISNVKISAHPKTGQGDWSDFEEAPG